MSKFIQAKQGLDNTVIYQDESGKLYRFSKGTWSWRNHNPGNLRSKRKGSHLNQIGDAGNFAVFPDYDSGVKALIDCLKTEYKNKSIDNLVSKYAPPKENNVKLYRKFLQQKTGVSVKLKIKNYSEVEFIKLWNAIIVYEEYQTGNIDEIYTVNQVKKNYLGICEFFVETMGWISKSQMTHFNQI